MAKKLVILATGVAFAFSAAAVTISPEAALQRASQGKALKVLSKAGASMKHTYTQNMPSGSPAAYIFQSPAGTGFVVLSADDSCVPMLGYSDTDAIDVNNLSPSMKAWLEEYGRQAEYMSTHGMRAAKAYAPAEYTAIAPLLKTTWDQGAPYNEMCPTVDGAQAPTGCVATSMAQVMNYFKYPDIGVGAISYKDAYGVSRFMNFAAQPFDWDNMLDSYVKGQYDEAQASAVAYLMKACGYSLEMSYAKDGSGAVSSLLAQNIVKYFNYDEAAWYADRIYYSTDEWTAMIYDNLKNVGPVIYDGRALLGGHSFIVDGYDGNGYFHLNWGWGGVSNGYYLLDALNPEDQGIGGAEGGFSYSQGATLGIQKPKGLTFNDRVKIYGILQGTLNGSNIDFKAVMYDNSNYCGYASDSYRSISVNVGAIISKPDGTKVAEVQGSVIGLPDPAVMDIDERYYLSSNNATPRIPVPSGLADGTYKVTLASRNAGDHNAPWLPFQIQYGLPNYCWLTVEGSNMTVTNGTPATISMVKGEIDSPLYEGRRVRLLSDFRNDTDLQLTLCYYPVLYREGRMQYKGDFTLVTVDPHSVVERESEIYFSVMDNATVSGPGTYTLQYIDVNNGKVIGTFGDYEMSTVTSTLKVEVIDMSVEGAPQQNLTIGSRTFKDVYMVKNASDFDINFAYKVTTGYLDRSIRLVLGEYNPETNTFVADDEYLYLDHPFLGQGEEKSVVLKEDFASRNLNTIYQVRGIYKAGTKDNLLTKYIYFAFDNSGVDDIITDGNEGNAEYFTLQGIRIEKPVKGQLLIRKTSNKTEKVIF